MKTNIELAREAGEQLTIFAAKFPEMFHRYTVAVEARLMAKLLEGAGEPARIEQELYGDEFRYYTPNQIAAAVLREREEVERLKRLSVENILIDVAPGDGSGLEVYAKSLKDVQNLLNELGDLCDEVAAIRNRGPV